MLIYDVDKIENLYQDFEKCQKDFKNKEYDDFRSSYFYNCSDSVIVKLRNRIQTIYDNIQKGYDMIDKVWKEYIDDVGNFDKSIASGGNCGIHDGGVSSIVSRICSLELYDTAGVSTAFKSLHAGPGSKFLNVLKRTFATVINTTVFGITSGLLKFVEGIVDCAVMIVGAVVGLVVLALDAGASLVMGDKRNGIDTTKKYFNKLMQCVGYDIVRKQVKERFYSTKFGKWFDDNSYAPFKSNGTGYKVAEAVGEIVGTVVLTVLTMGGGAAVSAAKTAATTGTKVGVKVAASAAKSAMKTAIKEGSSKLVVFAVRSAGAAGMKAQQNYNNFFKNEENKNYKEGDLSLGQIAKIMGTSVGQGVIDGAAYTLTYGNGLKAFNGVKGTGKIAQKISKIKIKNINVGQQIVDKATYVARAAGKQHSFTTTISKVGSKIAQTRPVQYIANTGIGSKVVSGTSSVIGKASNVASKLGKVGTSSKFLTGVKSKVAGLGNYLNTTVKTESLSKAGIQFAKTYANDGLADFADISKFNSKETASNALINAGVSVGYDVTFGKLFSNVADTSKEVLDVKAKSTSNLVKKINEAPVAEVQDKAADVGVIYKALEKTPTPIVKMANSISTFAGKNADGKKIVGTGIKKGPTNVLNDAFDYAA